MKPDPPVTRSLTALDGAISLIAILLVVQMWLLTSTLEAYLAGHGDVAIPASVISALLFATSFGLFRSIVSIDRRRPGRVALLRDPDGNPSRLETTPGDPRRALKKV